MHRHRQSLIFALNPVPKQKMRCKTRTQIKTDGIQRAMQWQSLIGTNGIESKADLARYLSVSRARVTQVLNRLVDHHPHTIETAYLTKS